MDLLQGDQVFIAEIKLQLDELPEVRAQKSDLALLICGFWAYINARITALEDLLDRLDSCIGCGCLSLATCELYHPDDVAAQKGAGPRYLM